MKKKEQCGVTAFDLGRKEKRIMIDFENCMKNKQHLDIHPDWWKDKTDEELKTGLQQKYEKLLGIRDKINKYSDKTIHENKFIQDLERFINIISGGNYNECNNAIP